MTAPFEQMSLISTPDKFVISARSAKAPGAENALVVHRGTGQICVEAVSRHLPLPSTVKYKSKTIYGVVGYVNVPSAGPLLLVMTRKIRLGDWPGGHVIWRMDGIEVNVNIQYTQNYRPSFQLSSFHCR